METTMTEVSENVSNRIVEVLNNKNHLCHGELIFGCEWVDKRGPLPKNFRMKLSGGSLVGEFGYTLEKTKFMENSNGTISHVENNASFWIKNLEWSCEDTSRKDIQKISQKVSETFSKYVENNFSENELLSVWNTGDTFDKAILTFKDAK